ncbi:pyridoxal phosphate-dependent decarboxylase family protein [Paenibacillus kobensis]|uniref:pyridoxal phosphate-dependent decarboxylase family protein n=1 Tax=Paenibacillus kobensis TaxID=59841 RepID=UPI000FDCCF61|nr:pyridoxal-dependent decarboxylase [Paenibacillus kobensis]
MFIRKNGSKERFAKRLEAYRRAKQHHHLLAKAATETEPRGTSLEGLLLGPKAENQALFQQLVNQAIDSHCDYRRAYFPDDPLSITPDLQQSENYKATVDGPNGLRAQFSALLEDLWLTPPFHSYRWQGHMNGDLTMPGMLGYMAGMLFNPNNVAAEASPATTLIEMEVGDQLCRMLGYSIPQDSSVDPSASRAWGHIACDGSVANLEAMWAARNMKYYGVSLAEALRSDPDFSPARDTTVKLLNGQEQRMIDLEPWTLLNLAMDDVLAVPEQIKSRLGKQGDHSDEDDRIDSLFNEVMNRYILQRVGFLEFHRLYLPTTPAPVVLGPVSMHYSWPKSAAVLGLGANLIKGVYVDLDCRMRLDHLTETLEACLNERRPVIMAVSVIGSTEESAVDPLVDILAVREQFRSRGLDFMIHADCAWGGYFAAILHEAEGPVHPYRNSTPALPMSEYVTNQYLALKHADSITIDPHKAGFIPYPAGGLCYRNSALRNIVSFTAPVVYHGGVDPTVGVYGIEGSKPGAAAAGVYLSHKVLGTDRDGYGQLLGKGIYNSKRFYAALVTLSRDEDPFFIVPVQRLPAQRNGTSVDDQLAYIREHLGPDKTNQEIESNSEAYQLLLELGSDHNIVTYMVGLKPQPGQSAVPLDEVNMVNQEIFRRLSVAPGGHLTPGQPHAPAAPMIVTSSQFQPEAYGEAFMSHLVNALQVDRSGTIDFIISTTTTPFLTDTYHPDGSSMLVTVMDILRATILDVIASIRTE